MSPHRGRDTRILWPLIAHIAVAYSVLYKCKLAGAAD